MALTAEKRDRIRKHVERARRARVAQRPRPPTPVVAVAILDHLLALGGLIGLGLLVVGALESARMRGVQAAVMFMMLALLTWGILMVGRGLLRCSRFALGLHVLVATYELLAVLASLGVYGTRRIEQGDVLTLAIHAVVVALLYSPSGRVWFAQGRRRVRLPRPGLRAREGRARYV